MLILSRDAEHDIKDAYDWYEEKQQNLGKAFITEVELIFRKIEENSQLHQLVLKNIRRALCRRFPYSIYFINAGDNIIVLGVLHQRRSPMGMAIKKIRL